MNKKGIVAIMLAIIMFLTFPINAATEIISLDNEESEDDFSFEFKDIEETKIVNEIVKESGEERREFDIKILYRLNASKRYDDFSFEFKDIEETLSGM